MFIVTEDAYSCVIPSDQDTLVEAFNDGIRDLITALTGRVV
jgi:hypothetical protein